MFEHKEGLGSAFTKKYGVKILAYYEGHGEIGAAIAREKAMKQWLRKWKLELIERENPTWRDLSEDFLA
jgi:putative endonuclease